MAYIYKITNDINQKVYVGKTSLSIEERFIEHCMDCLKERCEKRPLYNAMRKYGIAHFKIELIEECPTEQANEREIYWIAYYKGYEEGYNATTGGDGKPIFDHAAIAEALKIHPYPVDIAKQFNCSSDTVRTVAKEYHIVVKNKGQNNVNAPKEVSQFSKNGEYIQSFSSTQEAAEWCFENHLCTSLNSGVRSHIGEAANGKRKSAYGYIWQYN